MAELRFGKKAAVKDERTLMFRRYVKPEHPAPPESYSSLDRLRESLGTDDVAELFPMDGNDRYGCCVMAGAAHLITNFHGLVGRKEIMPEAEVIRIYLELTGGSDEGLVVLTTLKYWKRHGIGNHKIEGFVGLEEHDHSDVKTSIWLFGGVKLGFRVQDAAVSDFEHGRMWEPGRTDGSGHDVTAIGYTKDYIELLTWGGLQRGSWDWWNEMVDESYGILPPEAREPAFAPGFDFAALQEDLVAITG